MSAQHTPGPWVVVWSPKTGRPVGIDAPNDADIPGAVGGVVRQNGIGMPGSALGCANARLIAAAPDMLAALREIAADIDNDAVPGWQIYQKAIAAIAMATESPDAPNTKGCGVSRDGARAADAGGLKDRRPLSHHRRTEDEV